MTTGYVLVDTPNPYTAQGVFPRRGGARLSGTVIVHTSEGNWRSGVNALANLVRNRADYGCYHQACDWADIAKFYPWEWETWQDSETNNWAVGISAACKTSDWGTMPADVEEGYYRNLSRMAADFVRYMRTKGVEVPRVRITGAQARARVPGFCAHGDSGISRSDPGANFNWSRFFGYVEEELSGVAALGEVTPTNEQENEDKMLIIGKLADDDKVWVGDGITRRHITNQETLESYQWYGVNGWLKIHKNGEVQTLSASALEALGREVAQ